MAVVSNHGGKLSGGQAVPVLKQPRTSARWSFGAGGAESGGSLKEEHGRTAGKGETGQARL